VFISEHCRRSPKSGHGVQRLAGHVESFVDLIIDEYLPEIGEFLDLGVAGMDSNLLWTPINQRESSPALYCRSGLE
jgi:hypothetical protein